MSEATTLSATLPETAPARQNGRAGTLALALILAFGTLLVYWPVRQFEFINYDDQDYVYENPTIKKGLTAEGLRWAFTTRFAANWHPLTWISHMADCQIWGEENPGGHHFTNLLLHTAATIALFFALRRMTGFEGRSAMVAALFALHPLHVESVAWVAERKDVLSGLFWMLTLWAYAWYAERPGVARYVVVAVTFALGLMSKPMVVTLPCVMLLLDYWPLRRGIRWLEKAPFFLLSVASGVVTFIVQREGGAVYPFAEKLSLAGRIGNAFVAYVSYLGKTVLPEDLAVLYPHPGHWPLWQVTGAAMIVLLITAGVVAFAKARPYLATGWFWFLGTLVPVIGLVQVGEQYMADRYSYIPLVGIFMMLVWGVSEMIATVPQRKMALAFAVIIAVGICVVGTRRQLGYWQNSIALFARTAQITKNNATAEYNLAQALSVKGLINDAVPHYEVALRIKPKYPEALNNLGLSRALLGQWTEATNLYERALQLSPQMSSVHLNYGFALLTLGRGEQALRHFEAALKDAGSLALAHFGYGRALLGAGKLEQGIRELRDALGKKPDYAEAMFYLGLALAERGDVEQGITQIRRAAELVPNAADAHMHLGRIYSGQGKMREALAEYKEAVRLNPNYPELLNNYAWLLATHREGEIRNGHLAVELSERACELTKYQVPLFVGTLAAAYAEVGRFDEAVKTAQKARDLAVAQQQDALVKKNLELIAIYQAGKAYREN